MGRSSERRSGTAWCYCRRATGELPGVALPFLLRLDLTIGIVVIGIVLVSNTTIRQAHHRVEVIEQVVVCLAIGRAFAVQQVAAILTAQVVGTLVLRRTSHSQSTVVEGRTVNLHLIGLHGSSLY